jgi:hypothetical protein
MRLMAGFGEADRLVARILTAADARGLVAEEELRAATASAGALLTHFLSLPEDRAAALRRGAADARPAVNALAALPALNPPG